MRLLPSKRGHLYVLERARIYVRDGRVEYASEREADGEPVSYNVPVANTSFLLIGPGSSITNEAVRILRGEGVCFGFCGSGGTPLFSGEEVPTDFLQPQDEYRDPGYLQRWVRLWLDDGLRLECAKSLMLKRAELIEAAWDGRPPLDGPWPNLPELALRRFESKIQRAGKIDDLLAEEGILTKELYRAAAQMTGKSFARTHENDGLDITDPNRLLNHGNYLAYGYANLVLWTLGIPSSLQVVHGKTRRGGLVFDLADVVKDAYVLPTAFNVSLRMAKGDLEAKESTFRGELIRVFQRKRLVEEMFTVIKDSLDEFVP